ncbi:MAG: 2-C-methyl-D-erythritol 4-phosphate cytidylyltransferase [Cytophagales bacterium]|nr:2-C-methyl-D-erythritol 4-phosphate cytidylyltransferase [Cytophagales bacterium]
MLHHALIVASGIGHRFGTEIPKQFLPLCGKPVLMHSMEAFFKFQKNIQLIVIVPENRISFWNNLCHQHHFFLPHKVVGGGNTRFHSVLHGLERLRSEQGIVAIHDGVRPLVSTRILQEGYTQAAAKHSAVPVLPLSHSLRKWISQKKTTSCPREKYCISQTPQFFDLGRLYLAFQHLNSSPKKPPTDEAAVWEAHGHNVNTFQGDPHNIKITYPHELRWAEVYLSENSKNL